MVHGMKWQAIFSWTCFFFGLLLFSVHLCAILLQAKSITHVFASMRNSGNLSNCFVFEAKRFCFDFSETQFFALDTLGKRKVIGLALGRIKQ